MVGPRVFTRLGLRFILLGNGTDFDMENCAHSELEGRRLVSSNLTPTIFLTYREGRAR